MREAQTIFYVEGWELKLGASSLFAIARSFKSFLNYVRKTNSVKVWEIIDEAETRLTPLRISELNDLARTKGLEFTLHAPFLDVNFASLSPYMRKASLKHLENSLFKAYLLGCRVLVVHGGFYPHVSVKDRAYELSRDSIRKLALKAVDYGVKIAVENGPAGYSFLYVEADEVLKQFSLLSELENVGLCLDVGHANTSSELKHFLQKAGDLILHVHIHDNDGKRDLHLYPGEGTVDWHLVFEGLKQTSFDGYIIVETASSPLLGVKTVEKWLKARG